VSANVLLEGIREHGNRRGLLRMALDVITFVITWRSQESSARFTGYSCSSSV
jgi:hypothetical protein